MAVRIVEPRTPIVERPLWCLAMAHRTAVAVVHKWPHGHELRIEIDGMLLRWSRLYRGEAKELDDESEAKRRALLVRGWSE